MPNASLMRPRTAILASLWSLKEMRVAVSDGKAGLTYRAAGVDIDAGEEVVRRIKPAVARTTRPEVLGGLGGFGALFALGQRYADPVLVSGTDGVGTKLKLAQQWARHDTIGIDLVGMCVNDVLVQGAEPLFFLDYFATGKLDIEITVAVIEGIARGCELAGCALVGGETAEMPDMYPPGEYDLAGFCVGAVERAALLDGSRVRAGDRILGLASSGPHANGYSLIRRILANSGLAPDTALGHGTLADALLAPTRIYVRPVLALLAQTRVAALAHITGGGLTENIIRVIPEGLAITLDASAWPQQPVFDWLRREGPVADAEMWRTFNCGIGFCLIVAPDDVADVGRVLLDHGIDVHEIGAVRTDTGGARVTIG